MGERMCFRPGDARTVVVGCVGHVCSECGESVAPGTGDDWFLEGVVYVATTHPGVCSAARGARLLSGVSS